MHTRIVGFKNSDGTVNYIKTDTVNENWDSHDEQIYKEKVKRIQKNRSKKK